MENNIILVLIIIENLRLIILVKYKLKKKNVNFIQKI